MHLSEGSSRRDRPATMYRVVLCTFIFMSMALSSASSLPESPISSPPESRKKSLQRCVFELFLVLGLVNVFN